MSNPKWEFGPEFSQLAQSLFLKLVKLNPLERYSANEALQHPWITREPGKIPLSYVDSIAYEHAKESLVKGFLTIFFISAQCFVKNPPETYLTKISEFSEKLNDFVKTQELTTQSMNY